MTELRPRDLLAEALDELYYKYKREIALKRKK